MRAAQACPQAHLIGSKKDPLDNSKLPIFLLCTEAGLPVAQVDNLQNPQKPAKVCNHC
jgi:hypothetical protein